MCTVHRTMQWPLIIIMHWCILHFIPMATIYIFDRMLYDILSHKTTTLLLRNCICPLSPTSQFFNSGHMTVFHSSMCIYLCHVNLAILVVIQLFCSVSSCPYRKNGYFVYSNSEGLWQHFLWVFRCFGMFWTISDIFLRPISCQLVTF